MNASELVSTGVWIIYQVTSLAMFACCFPPIRDELRHFLSARTSTPIALWTALASLAALAIVLGGIGFQSSSTLFVEAGGGRFIISVPGMYLGQTASVLVQLAVIFFFLDPTTTRRFERLMQRDVTKKLLWGLSFLATILVICALGLMIFVQVGLTTMGSPSSQARLSDYILPYAGLAVTALLLVYLWNRFTLRGPRSIARKIALSGVLIVFLLLCLGYFDRFLFSVSFLAPIAVWTHLLFYNTLRRFFIWIMAVGYLYFIWNSADSRRQAGVAVRLFQAGVIIVGVGMGLQGPSHSRPGIGDLAVYSNSEGNETVLKNNEAIVDKQAEVVLKSFLEYYAQHESLSVVDVGFTRSLGTTETLLDADYLQVRLGAGFDAFCEVHAQCQLLGYRSVPNAALYNIPTLVDSSGSWLELTIVPQGGKVTRSQNRVSFVGKKLIVKRCSKNPPPRRTYDNTCGIATVPFPGVSGEKTLGPAIAHWKY